MKQKIKSKKQFPKWVVWVLIAIVVSWMLSAAIIYCSLSDWEKRGTFGDMFGSINALFSGLAFFGVIITIFLQKEELELQRQEIEKTRKELEKSVEAQKNNEKILKNQVESSLIAAKVNALKYLIESSDFDRINASDGYFKKVDLLKELKQTMGILNSKLNDIKK